MSDYKYYLDNGIFAIKKCKFEDGIDYIDKSLDLKNDWEIPYFYRAVAYQALEEYDNAILDYTKALQLNDKMVDAYYNRAKILLTRQDIEDPDLNRAESDLKKALELDDKFVDALYAMAAVLKKLDRYEEAVIYLDRLLEIQPDSVNAKALKKLLLTKYL